PGQEVRGTRRGVPDHDGVDAHRLDVLGRVDERLALAQAGAAGREVEGVGPEPAGGEAEAGAGARGRLEEQVGDDPALEVGSLLLAAVADAGEGLGEVEDAGDLSGGQLFEAEQVPAGPGGGWRGGRHGGGGPP